MTQAAKLLLAACLGLVSMLSSAQNLSDHWFNPDESGWGLSITHQGPVIFAVLYVYSRTSVDQAGKGAPEWYVMPDMRDISIGSSPIAPVQFRGTLYAGRGSPYNIAFNAASTQVTAVGEASIMPDSDGAGAQLTYRIGDTTVTKRIRRMSLARLPLTGTYGVKMAATVNPSLAGASCANAGTIMRDDVWTIGATGSVPSYNIFFQSFDFAAGSLFAMQVSQAGSTATATIRPLSSLVGPATWTLKLDHVGAGGWSGTLRIASDTTVTGTVGGDVITLPACVLNARITGTRTTNVNAF